MRNLLWKTLVGFSTKQAMKSPLSHRVRCFCGRHFGSCSSRDEKKLQDQDHYQQVAADEHQLLATAPGDSTTGEQVLL